ncbi:Uncharacterised protein [Streptococcus equinus]|nr:Uncharacterised protein [Streptococcus equinus]VTS82428.1 Uncharacterised protein [Streptococcus equinus]
MFGNFSEKEQLFSNLCAKTHKVLASLVFLCYNMGDN